MWQLNCDTRHVTCDMYTWHMTCDRWGKVNLLSKCKFPNSYSIEWKSFEESFTKDESLNDWLNHKGVCRTAQATPGLLMNFAI